MQNKAAISISKRDLNNIFSINSINNHKINMNILERIDDNVIEPLDSKKLCKTCKTYFNPLQNTMLSCRFHKG